MTTDAGVHEADFLVVALGADYDFAATPGPRARAGTSSTRSPGAERLRDAPPDVHEGHAIDRRLRRAVQVPAGAERVRAAAARLSRRARRARRLRDLLRDAAPRARAAVAGDLEGAPRGVRRARHRRSSPDRRVSSLDPARSVAVLDDGSELPYDLFLGVPKHRAPDVVLESGMTRGRLHPGRPARRSRPSSRRLRRRRRRHRRRAEGRRLRRGRGAGRRRVDRRDASAAASSPSRYDGRGSCYIEFGAGRVGRVDVDFFSGPKPTGVFNEPSDALVRDKEHVRLEPPCPLVR